MAVISCFRQRFVINTMYSLEHHSLEMVAMTTFEICCSETSGVTSACQAKSSYGTNCFDSGPKVWNRKIFQRDRQLQRCTAASFDCQRSVDGLAATTSSKCMGDPAITGALVSVNERQSSKKKLPLKFELPRGSWTEAEWALKTIWSIHRPLPWALSGMGWRFSISVRAAGRSMVNWSLQTSWSSSRPVMAGRVLSMNVEQHPDSSDRGTICYGLSFSAWTHLMALGSMIPTRSCEFHPFASLAAKMNHLPTIHVYHRAIERHIFWDGSLGARNSIQNWVQSFCQCPHKVHGHRQNISSIQYTVKGCSMRHHFTRL